MKFNFFITIIIVFLIKTGNVLSNEGIFNVNNIEIDTQKFKNNKNYIDDAFRKGFKKLADRILLEKDYNKVKQANITQIKELISHYQISKKIDDNNKEVIQINIFFDKKKLNFFFYTQRISYSDFTKSSIVIFPILIKNDDFFIYDNNFFYKNLKNSSYQNQELIEYILPIENLENFQIVKNSLNNLESLNVTNLLSDYKNANYSILIVDELKDRVNILLKCSINKKNITKTFVLKKDNLPEEELYRNIIFKTKKEILEIIKSQNIIDLQTPSFLNVSLEIGNNNDLLNLQSALEKIDLIENFSVIELNKNEVKMKIKYYGKIKSITEKFRKFGIKVLIKENQWKLKLI